MLSLATRFYKNWIIRPSRGLVMTITMELTQDEFRSVKEAEARGVDVHALLRSIIASLSQVTPPDHFYFTASSEEWEAAMDELAEGGENLPILPPEAYDRENMYEDRF
jgi:hypothetical protein